jgi:hypothetical protein
MIHMRRWQEDKRTALRLLAVLTVLVLAGLGLLTVFSGGNDEGPSQARLQGQARGSCQEWVREQLAPSLPVAFVDVRVAGSGPWSITGQVDYANHVGGKFRTGWTCDARREGTLMKGAARLLR